MEANYLAVFFAFDLQLRDLLNVWEHASACPHLHGEGLGGQLRGWQRAHRQVRQGQQAGGRCPQREDLLKSLSKGSQKSFKSLSKVSQKSLKSFSKVFQKSFKSRSKVAQKSLKSLSKVSQKSLKSLSKVSQKSLKSFSKVFQKSLKRFSKVSQKSFKRQLAVSITTKYCKGLATAVQCHFLSKSCHCLCLGWVKSSQGPQPTRSFSYPSK